MTNDEIYALLKERDDCICQCQSMREAIGRLPKKSEPRLGKEEWDYIYQSTRDAILACHAAAQPSSPRAKEIAERLEDYDDAWRLLREYEPRDEYCLLALTLRIDGVLKMFEDRLAKAEAAARAGQVLRMSTHKLIGDGHNRCVVRKEHVLEYDETIRSLAAEPQPKESEVKK